VDVKKEVKAAEIRYTCAGLTNGCLPNIKGIGIKGIMGIIELKQLNCMHTYIRSIMNNSKRKELQQRLVELKADILGIMES